eukprot:GFKZ01001007.1.p1 GENE.GFKZ01001007.1~~GFKZ01001007.1.p1  ORF type:complete len:256 (-),score=27.98 GFKZ01001007.1:138-824(-)
MAISSLVSLSALILAVAASENPFPGCSGNATYEITFTNFLTPGRFRNLIPETGLVFSPLAAVSHSNRLSFFTIRGFANKPVEILAETGSNTRFISLARRLRAAGRGVLSVTGADAVTMPGGSTTLEVDVDCENPFVTMLGMIAPSPDWIVQINNRNLFDVRARRFVRRQRGTLIAYDAGVDDGREFTPPMDLSLDLPTVPQKNIAPLVEDETDRFEGRVVGRFEIRKV